MMSSKRHRTAWQRSERRGNIWSGVVAMVLLAMFALALVSSELDATEQLRTAQPTTAVIAGQ